MTDLSLPIAHGPRENVERVWLDPDTPSTVNSGRRSALTSAYDCTLYRKVLDEIDFRA
jgi:hypothetical protein